jgi:CsoR family transcriptional regulator, copper-sensing transcriptional repressor
MKRQKCHFEPSLLYHPLEPDDYSELRLYYPHRGALTRDTPGGYRSSMKQQIKKRLSRRLKIIEGQVRGLQHMVEHEKYCMDVINQSLAVKEALSRAEELLLENHLATHVPQQMRSGKKSQVIQEVLSVYKMSRRK